METIFLFMDFGEPMKMLINMMSRYYGGVGGENVIGAFKLSGTK